MRVALAQMTSVNNLEYNFQQIEKIILECDKKSAELKPQIIIFPENSLFFRIDDGEKIQPLSVTDLIFQKLKKLSKTTNTYLHLTTAMLDSDKVWNASVLISPFDEPRIVYKKIHLFDIALEGQKPIRESDVFANGDVSSVFEIEGIKFGSSICYDIRFAELYSLYAKQSVDVILIPAAFLVKTGKAHWDVLLRARAIENQSYVLAPAQTGRHLSTSSEQSRETYGHTMAVGPWGDVIECLSDGVDVLLVNIDPENCRAVRRQIPMQSHRRL